MKVDVNLIRQLRDETQAPLKDCKEFLEQTNGDIELARKLLIEKGLNKADKKADRETKEWVVRFVQDDSKVYGIVLACETDFVAKNENFQNLINSVLSKVSAISQDVDGVDQLPQEVKAVLDQEIREWIARIGENIRLTNVFIRHSKGVVYSHPWDKLSAVVFYGGTHKSPVDVSREIALQVAAMNPTYKDVESVPAEMRNQFKDQFTSELAGSNKPADIIEKIVEWKLSKRYEEFVLTEQIYIRDESKKIKHLITDWYELLEFRRFSI